VSQAVPTRKAGRAGTHWEYLLPILTVHLLACLAFLPWCFSWSGVTLALAGTLVFGTLGINLCYHRLLAHRSLRVSRGLERSLATVALCSLEDTPARWVSNHRLHHVHSDDELDPHSPRDGIGWSHAGWLFRRAPDRRTYAFFEKYARDILADDYYRWLERHPLAILWIYAIHAACFAGAGLAECVVEQGVHGPKHHADLVRAVRVQLERCGLAAAHIDAEPPCTYADRTRFFSYRRDGAASGRLAAIIAPR
jgi:stearoyl-CoA desaturase (delta-9 desaturase)